MFPLESGRWKDSLRRSNVVLDTERESNEIMSFELSASASCMCAFPQPMSWVQLSSKAVARCEIQVQSAQHVEEQRWKLLPGLPDAAAGPRAAAE